MYIANDTRKIKDFNTIEDLASYIRADASKVKDHLKRKSTKSINGYYIRFDYRYPRVQKSTFRDNAPCDNEKCFGCDKGFCQVLEKTPKKCTFFKTEKQVKQEHKLVRYHLEKLRLMNGGE